MTFNDDHVLIPFISSEKRVTLNCLSLEWPPPKVINIEGTKYERVRYSLLTDEQRKEMDFIIRGAEYKICSQEQH